MTGVGAAASPPWAPPLSQLRAPGSHTLSSPRRFLPCAEQLSALSCSERREGIDAAWINSEGNAEDGQEQAGRAGAGEELPRLPKHVPGVAAKYQNMVSVSLRSVLYQGSEGNLGQLNVWSWTNKSTHLTLLIQILNQTFHSYFNRKTMWEFYCCIF